MADEWIKMRIDLASDPSVLQIASMLGIDEDAVVGKLHRLWGWATRMFPSGDAPGVTPGIIDRLINKAGFAHAMVTAGWLVEKEGGVVFPEFNRYSERVSAAPTRAPSTKPPVRRKRTDDADWPDPETDNREGHEKLMALWLEYLPELPCLPAEQWTPIIKGSFYARWNEAKHRQTWQYWRDALRRVAASDYLMGRRPGRNGGLHQLTVPMLLRPEFLPKLEAGTYDTKTVALRSVGERQAENLQQALAVTEEGGYDPDAQF